MASFDLTRADGEGTTCPQCTYINDDGEDSCEVCGAALEGASSGDDVDRDEKAWTCLACTFENGHADASCAVCTTPRSGTAPPCSSCHKAAANPPFASCCRPCALSVPGCACAPLASPPAAATTKAAAKSPAAPKASARSRPPSGATSSSSTGVPGAADSAAAPTAGETLTSEDMFALLSECGESFRHDSVGSGTGGANLLRVLRRLHRHVAADRAQTQAAQARAKESFTWEWQEGVGSGGGRRPTAGGGRGGWSALSAADQLTIEAERRSGRRAVVLTSGTGERVDLDLNGLTATFSLSRRTVALRATPSAADSGAASESGSVAASAAKAKAGSAEECQVSTWSESMC